MLMAEYMPQNKRFQVINENAGHCFDKIHDRFRGFGAQ